MTIGINAAAALKQPRTGVEEYCYQLIKHLTMLPEAKAHRFFLYVPKSDTNTRIHLNDSNNKYFDFELPINFEVRKLNWPLSMWTQIRLASHMVFNKPDVLFIPVHVLPRFHPKNSVVTIHGLEYEYFPEYYPFWFRNYLCWSTRYAVKHARKIIAVSENTKRDIIKFYRADVGKIEVVYHGVKISRCDVHSSDYIFHDREICNQGKIPTLLYIGRIELKKNILGILEVYKILKEKYKISHELILAGAPGYGYEKIKLALTENISPLQRRNVLRQVRELGYVSEAEKWKLLRGADAFLFPTFYEGFGMPILEAQAAGVPVVSSNVSSIREVARDSALLIDPNNPEQIAQAVYKIIDDKALRDKLIELGFDNIKRFSWEKCARETLRIMTS